MIYVHIHVNISKGNRNIDYRLTFQKLFNTFYKALFV